MGNETSRPSESEHKKRPREFRSSSQPFNRSTEAPNVSAVSMVRHRQPDQNTTSSRVQQESHNATRVQQIGNTNSREVQRDRDLGVGTSSLQIDNSQGTSRNNLSPSRIEESVENFVPPVPPRVQPIGNTNAREVQRDLDVGTSSLQIDNSQATSRNNLSPSRIEESVENFVPPVPPRVQQIGNTNARAVQRDLDVGTSSLQIDNSQATSRNNLSPSRIEESVENLVSPVPNISSQWSYKHNVDIMHQVNPKLQLNQVKNNLGTPAKSAHNEVKSTLNNLDNLSEALCNVSINKSTVSNNSTNTEVNLKNSNYYTLEQCTDLLKSVQVKNNGMTDMLESESLHNLKCINNFILALSLCPSLGDDIQSEIERLQQNLSYLISSTESSSSASSLTNLSDLNNPKTNYSALHDAGIGHRHENTTDDQNMIKTQDFEVSDETTQLSNEKVKEDNYISIMDIILESNKKRLHLDVPLYVCKLCDDVLYTEDEADTHPRNVHSLSQMSVPCKWYFCKPCGLHIYSTEHQYRQHTLNSAHTEIRRLKAENGDEEEQLADARDHAKLKIGNEQDSKKSYIDEGIRPSVLNLQEAKNVRLEGPAVDELDRVDSESNNNLTGQAIPNEIESVDCATSVTYEDDRLSVSSSSSTRPNRLNPRGAHEILISIARSKATNDGESVGVFCQICAVYQLYGPQCSNHFTSEKHVKNLLKYKKNKGFRKHCCKACHIDLFGDFSIVKNHNSLPMHIESLTITGRFVKNQKSYTSSSPVELPSTTTNDNNLVQNKNLNDFSGGVLMSAKRELQMLVSISGAHFELMKEVLKKHIVGVNAETFGFYCSICEEYSLDENQWLTHLSRPEHEHRYKAKERAADFVVQDCHVCKVRFICDENTLSQHQESDPHKAINRLKEKRQSESLDRNSDEMSESEEESSEGGSSEDEYSSDVRSNASSNNPQLFRSNQDVSRQANTTKKIVNTAIYVTGLPANTNHPTILGAFKVFGVVSKCFVNVGNRSATLHFKRKIDAQRALNTNVNVQGRPVQIAPFFRSEPRKRVRTSSAALASQVSTVLGSHAALDAFVRQMQAELAETARMFSSRASHIMSDVQVAWPSCIVHLFGSQVAGLASPNSDYDIYIDHDGRSFRSNTPQHIQEQILVFFVSKFTAPNSPFEVKEPILDARVPILRLVHRATGIPCDISCRSGLSVENSKLVKLYVESDARVHWLVMAVKWWMRANGLLDKAVFTSYATTWMVLFFLMNPLRKSQGNVVCPVFRLQERCPEYNIGGWDCRFQRKIPAYLRPSNLQEPLELLMQFFIFYGTQDFKKEVLCPLTGTVILRGKFQSLILPPLFQHYVDRAIHGRDHDRLRVTTPICVQDPFDLSHNITKGVNRHNLKKFKELCVKSAQLCRDLQHSTR